MSKAYAAVIAGVAALLALFVGVALFFSGPVDIPRDKPPTTGPAASSSAPESGSEPLKNYVALGDSFASMGSRTTASQADRESALCMRSEDNYARILAGHQHLSLTDVSCQGAITAHVTSEREADFGGIPPQASALTRETQLVTISMGGNDISFGAMAACAATGQDCRQALGAQVDRAIKGLAAKLDAAYAAIKDSAPNAQIIATGYLPLVAESDTCEFTNRISTTDLGWFVEVTNRVNGAVKEAAERNGATYVLPADAQGHTGCAEPELRWTSFDGQATGSYPMHPTPEGQRAMAAAIADVL